MNPTRPDALEIYIRHIWNTIEKAWEGIDWEYHLDITDYDDEEPPRK